MAGLMDELNRVAAKVQDGAKELLDKTDIDEKIVSAARELKDRAQQAYEKVRPDVEATLAKASVGAKELIDKGIEKLNAPETKDAMDQIREQVDAQVARIRAAATTSDPIHDFFNSKPEAPAEEPAVEEPAAEEPVTEEAPAPAEEAPIEEEPAPEEEAPIEKAPADEDPAAEEPPIEDEDEQGEAWE